MSTLITMNHIDAINHALTNLQGQDRGTSVRIKTLTSDLPALLLQVEAYNLRLTIDWYDDTITTCVLKKNWPWPRPVL